jgi:hypothetical protein
MRYSGALADFSTQSPLMTISGYIYGLCEPIGQGSINCEILHMKPEKKGPI